MLQWEYVNEKGERQEDPLHAKKHEKCGLPKSDLGTRVTLCIAFTHSI